VRVAESRSTRRAGPCWGPPSGASLPLARWQALSPADRLNYDLFRRQYEESVEAFRFREFLIPLTQRGGAGMSPNAEAAGTLTGNERFLRQNRSILDFVGRDAQASQNFVGTLGNQGASAGEIRAAIDSSTRQAQGRTNVNRPRSAPRAR
jgi:uncharacterized protein (DUF885 family)